MYGGRRRNRSEMSELMRVLITTCSGVFGAAIYAGVSNSSLCFGNVNGIHCIHLFSHDLTLVCRGTT